MGFNSEFQGLTNLERPEGLKGKERVIHISTEFNGPSAWNKRHQIPVSVSQRQPITQLLWPHSLVEFDRACLSHNLIN